MSLTRRVPMRFALGCSALLCLVLAGCGEKPQSLASAESSVTTSGEPRSDGQAADASATPAAETPAAADAKTGASTVEITPENTTITFIGTHAAPKAKDPRTGNFEKFSGTAELDAANKKIKSLSVDIDT